MPFQNDILAGTSANQTSYEGFYENWYEGDLWGWGANQAHGGVGDQSTINRSSPVAVGSDKSDWIINSFHHTSYYGEGNTFAWQSDGSLWCWGPGNQKCFLDLEAQRCSPAQIGTSKVDGAPSTTGWISKNSDNKRVGMMFHSAGACNAIRADGTLWGWGYNGGGRLGLNNATTPMTSATQIGSDLWIRVGGGEATRFAIKEDGSLWSWGVDAGTYGILGDGTTIGRSSPAQIGSDKDWYNVVGHNECGFAVKTDGTLWSWGSGASGYLGDGTTAINRCSPAQIGSATNWAASGMSNGHVYMGAINTDGELYMWGPNTNGELGLSNETTAESTPQQVGTDTNWKHLSIGTKEVCAMKTDGTVWTWGFGYLSTGVLGDGTTIARCSPVQIGSGTDWLQIMCAGQIMHAIKTP